MKLSASKLKSRYLDEVKGCIGRRLDYHDRDGKTHTGILTGVKFAKSEPVYSVRVFNGIQRIKLFNMKPSGISLNIRG